MKNEDEDVMLNDSSRMNEIDCIICSLYLYFRTIFK